MFGSLRYSVARAVRRTGYSIAAAFFMAIGLAFLTVAAWIYLATVQSAMFAALIIGCVYVGIGLILLGLGTRSRPVPMAHYAGNPPPAAGTAAGIAAALMQGIGAGMAAGAARKQPPPPPPAGE